ncbi:MAG: PH domain-containing protein [Planctomycetota bacterium]|nr:PH domain-containing protein [Planctomycetota bacterium]
MAAPVQQGPETNVWQGTPSQWTNIIPFVLCVLIIPIPYAIYRWLAVKLTRFTLTNQRFRTESGILNKHFDDLELYRVKDITLSQPLIQRLVGLGTITMITSDATSPRVVLPAIADSMRVMDLIRAQVERARRERGVRELDVHDQDVPTALG